MNETSGDVYLGALSASDIHGEAVNRPIHHQLCR